jgi:hypothetical protein
MVAPLRNPPRPLNPNADNFQPSLAANWKNEETIAGHNPDEHCSNDTDLQRLETSVQWLKREVLIVQVEAVLRTQKQRRRLPRVAQLVPVFRVPSVNTEETAEALPFHVARPLASERLPFTPTKGQQLRNLRGMLCFLVASVVAGSIAYHISTAVLFSASVPAQAAHLQVQ